MKFACKESCGGKCCSVNWDVEGSQFIFLTEHDLLKIENRTGKSRDEFAVKSNFSMTRFSGIQGEYWYLKNLGDACQFLRGGQCSIYEDRPTQCKTYPFWPENMDEYRLREIGKFCPGSFIEEENDSLEIDSESLLEQQKADAEILKKDHYSR